MAVHSGDVATHLQETGVALETVLGALAAVDHAAREELDDGERLRLIELADAAKRRTDALFAVLLAEADEHRSAMVVRGTPLTSLLALSGQLSSKEAAGLVLTGRDLVVSEAVRDAALAGDIGVRQARAITRVMEELPTDLDDAQRIEAEKNLLERAGRQTAYQLERVGPEILADIAPALVEQPAAESARLSAQQQRAWLRRSLGYRSDGHGSLEFWGSLPEAEGAAFVKVIEAYTEADRRAARNARDVQEPLSPIRLLGQRRADALMALVAAVQRDQRAPGVGGDRPRVVVVMRESDLELTAAAAGMLLTGEAASAGDLRRLCCDADLVPAVLGAASEVLDLGRAQRLVSSDLRQALSLRDGGCAFPGCSRADVGCEAHHIEPWERGGATSLDNLVLLCPHHHRLVEPRGRPQETDEWEVRMGNSRLPEFIPPARLDPARLPVTSNGYLHAFMGRAAA